MKKSATLITTALLTFGLAAASMAADAPKSGTPAAADSTSPAPATKSHKHSSKKHKKSTGASTTTK
jgi:ABC-type phosphate transport system substrate-binding protein